jgi:ADP-heptose:LPS heptosyltransferase
MKTIKEFYSKRNRILICHSRGGLGDILMQRMIFEDIKKQNKNFKITFACLPEYIEAVEDHEDLDEVISIKDVKKQDYHLVLDTCTTVADRYENINSPCKDHRSDIWAKYCGIKLSNHDMKINLDENKIKNFKKNLKEKDGPIVMICPVSKMMTKSLLDWQIEAIINSIKNNVSSSNVFGLHSKKIDFLEKNNIKTIHGLSIKEWMHCVASCDYMISVDTAAFHLAGDLKIPMTGIFTFADGKVYGKYFDFILVQKHRDNKNWDCGPCYKFASCPRTNKQIKPCLTEITAKELDEGISNMFNKWN